ncbi:MAG TPA: cyclopropane-fatty-acyl-phospholipid synthase family protein, partial [Xanthobacteraceae bacterium]|nr:cyclopropane-fatty-acyl-phospholipid synthase family protein [Xanthobacteraceae bacterium]
MMQFALDLFLRRFITVGRLTVRWPDGRTQTYTGPQGSGAEAGVVLRDRYTVRRLVLNPELGFGEAYIEGGLGPLGGSMHDVLAVLLANVRANPNGLLIPRLRRRAARMSRPLDQFNAVSRARRNVAHHYDLNGRLYGLFLDRDRAYSCAYFPKGTETLEQAQAAKKRHIAAKLCLDRPGLSVLDIGCGWGGMALTLARDYGARVTGITLSTEQLSEARARAEAEGLADRVSFELLDYRVMDQRFDRIVSVGMFEHVGVVYYRTFVDTVARCLAPGGVALLHTIGQWDGPGTNNPWLRRYIFPGAYCPALSEVMPALVRS